MMPRKLSTHFRYVNQARESHVAKFIQARPAGDRKTKTTRASHLSSMTAAEEQKSTNTSNQYFFFVAYPGAGILF